MNNFRPNIKELANGRVLTNKNNVSEVCVLNFPPSLITSY